MNYINNWIYKLSDGLTVEGEALPLPSAAISRLNLAAGVEYTLTLSNALGAVPAEAFEIIKVVGAAGGAYTLERGLESTAVAEWPADSVIMCSLTAGQLAALASGTGVELADVATSGSYNDLSNKPSIPTTPAQIGAATAAQGAKADSAVQPAALSSYMTTAAASSALAGKVDKVGGYGLSQSNFTAEEKAKLAGLEAAHYRGLHVSIAALEAAVPTSAAGDYADVDAGAGDPVLRYIWDSSDAEWVAQAGSAEPITAAQAKALYEANADTNAFTDARKDKLDALPDSAVSQVEAEAGTGTTVHSWTALRVRQAIAAWWAGSSMKTKLDGISTGATANDTDANLKNRANHTGAQAISTVTGLESALAGKQAALVSGTSIKTVNGQSLLGSGDLVIEGGEGSGPVAGVVGATFDAGGALIEAGSFCEVVLPYALNLSQLTVLTNAAGAAVLDVRVIALEDYPPTGSDSIVGSGGIELDAAVSLVDDALTGWTLELAAGSVVRFVVVSSSLVSKINVVLTGDRA